MEKITFQTHEPLRLQGLHWKAGATVYLDRSRLVFLSTSNFSSLTESTWKFRFHMDSLTVARQSLYSERCMRGRDDQTDEMHSVPLQLWFCLYLCQWLLMGWQSHVFWELFEDNKIRPPILNIVSTYFPKWELLGSCLYDLYTLDLHPERRTWMTCRFLWLYKTPRL